jgi:hypothetical protein
MYSETKILSQITDDGDVNLAPGEKVKIYKDYKTKYKAFFMFSFPLESEIGATLTQVENTVYQRIKKYLHNIPFKNAGCAIPIKQVQLAEDLGMATSNLSTIISSLKKKKLILVSSRKGIVLNPFCTWRGSFQARDKFIDAFEETYGFPIPMVNIEEK